MKTGVFVLWLFCVSMVGFGSAAIAGDESLSRPDVQSVRICPTNLDPVCAERRGVRKSFQNFCVAKSYGYSVLYGGRCRGVPRPPEPQVCPRIYDPVCAERRGVRQTFSNDCLAETRGFRVVYGGQCRVAPRPPRPPVPEGCSEEYRPVCGERNGVQRTFTNKCEGQARGFRLLYDSVCREDPELDQPNVQRPRKWYDR